VCLTGRLSPPTRVRSLQVTLIGRDAPIPLDHSTAEAWVQVEVVPELSRTQSDEHAQGMLLMICFPCQSNVWHQRLSQRFEGLLVCYFPWGILCVFKRGCGICVNLCGMVVSGRADIGIGADLL